MSVSAALLDHYEHPRNLGSLDKDDPRVGTGVARSEDAANVIRIQIRVEDSLIETVRFRTMGCTAAIAASSLLTERIVGRSLDALTELDPESIADELDLPEHKRARARLAKQAALDALRDFRHKQGDGHD